MREKELLTTYLQGVIGIHHPTVCPGGYHQEARRAQGEEAGDVLKKMPHVSEQPLSWAARELARCSLPGPWHRGRASTGLSLLLTPRCGRLELPSELHKQAVTHTGVLEVIIRNTQPPIRGRAVGGLRLLWERSPGPGCCPGRGLIM